MSIQEAAFLLLRCALDGQAHGLDGLQMDTAEWKRLFRLLQQGHVAALAAEALPLIPEGCRPPREVMLPWMVEADKTQQWARHQQAVQEEIVSLMQRHGIATLVLKGSHTAQYYPVPEVREYGDIDLYFYDRHREADEVARHDLGVEVSDEAHHHTKYTFRGVAVESHYDFVNRHYPPSNRRYEALLKELAPSATFEVMFLLRHMAGHFAASRITLRDLCDWYVACRALEERVDWTRVSKTVQQFGMEPFADAMSTLVERHFAYRIPLSIERTVTDTAINKVERDIVQGNAEAEDDEAEGWQRTRWKMRRWRTQKWKRRMVCSDSEASLLIASIAAHAAKPHSITHKL